MSEQPPTGGGAQMPQEPTGGAVPRTRRRAHGELEAAVLAVLQQAAEPATVTWVQDRLDGGLSYSTVITILSRLYEKQSVIRVREGRGYLWSAAGDGAGLAAIRMRQVLDGESDRGAVLTSFVSCLRSDDEALLRALLTEAAPEPDPDRSAHPADRHADRYPEPHRARRTDDAAEAPARPDRHPGRTG
ncbi:BlaI/MecI/CopY family transcriptional regulator [Kitasatospora sp. NPDC054939]